jgi:hypothetical protein
MSQVRRAFAALLDFRANSENPWWYEFFLPSTSNPDSLSSLCGCSNYLERDILLKQLGFLNKQNKPASRKIVEDFCSSLRDAIKTIKQSSRAVETTAHKKSSTSLHLTDNTVSDLLTTDEENIVIREYILSRLLSDVVGIAKKFKNLWMAITFAHPYLFLLSLNEIGTAAEKINISRLSNFFAFTNKCLWLHKLG